MNILRTISAARRNAAMTLGLLAMAAPLAAQTLTLTDSNATTLRGGTYASTVLNGQTRLETRASDDPAFERRVLLKFDTHNTIAAGTPITSAYLTITVAGGNSQTRTLSAYHVTTSYDQTSATWNNRKSGTPWGERGGDTGARFDQKSITNTAGTKVTFNVTALVQAIVRGDFGSSRYTRLLLLDAGADSRDS